jgi:hypothetical protein
MTTTQFFAVATMAATFLPLLMVRRAIKPAQPAPIPAPPSAPRAIVGELRVGLREPAVR